MQLAGFAIQFMVLGQTVCGMEKENSHLSGEDRVGSGFTFDRLALCWSRLCQQRERSAPLQKHCQIFLSTVLIMQQAPLMPETLQSADFVFGQPVLPFLLLPAGSSSQARLNYLSSSHHHLIAPWEPSNWTVHICQQTLRRACSRHPAQIMQQKVLPRSCWTTGLGHLRVWVLVSYLGEGGYVEVPLGNFKRGSSGAVVTWRWGQAGL